MTERTATTVPETSAEDAMKVGYPASSSHETDA